MIRILRGLEPLRLKQLMHPLVGRVVTEVYKVRCSLVTPDLSAKRPLGEVNVYVPTEPEYLSDEVLVGREVLNKLRLPLNGRWVEVTLKG